MLGLERGFVQSAHTSQPRASRVHRVARSSVAMHIRLPIGACDLLRIEVNVNGNGNQTLSMQWPIMNGHVVNLALSPYGWVY